MEKILLVGAGGHAKTIVDTLERQGKYQIVGFVDKAPNQNEIYRGYSVIGTDDDLEALFHSGVHQAVISVGYLGKSAIRNQLYCKVKEIGYTLPVIVDDTAVLATDVIIGEGTYIGRNAVINAAAKIGRMCIINTGAIIEHECRVGDYAHVSVGGVLCGNVEIGEASFVGANATIIQDRKVGSQCIIAAGTVVINNIPEGVTVAGVPGQVKK